MNKGLLYGLGSLAALMVAKNRTSGSRNESTSDICNSCLTGEGAEYSAKDLYDIMNECGYYLPQAAQVFEELIQEAIEESEGFGSFSKVSITMDSVLDQAVRSGTIKSEMAANFKSLYDKKLDAEQKKVVRGLIVKLNDKPFQVQVLFSIGIDVKTTLKSIIELVKAVGSRTFINRYLQRTAFIIDQKQQETPLFKNADMWKRQWVCDRISDISDKLVAKGFISVQSQDVLEDKMMSKQEEKLLSKRQQEAKNLEIETIIDEQAKRLDKLGLDLNRERIKFKKTTTGKILKDKPLETFERLEKLADVVWFIEMATQCGVRSQKDLFYTFPQETVFSRKINSLSAFDQIGYKLHLPVLTKENIAQQFPNVSNELGEEVINELIEKGKVVFDDDLHKPYVYFYKQNRTTKKGENGEKDEIIKTTTNEQVTLCFYSYASGSMKPKRTPVFTKTSKMNTISFSIPAGPPFAGGSCLSAATSKMAANPSFGVNDLTYVCQKCYALKNRYQMLEYVFSSAPRMNWITSTITDERNQIYYFGALMALAIESYCRYTYENGRDILEIGFIESDRIKYRSSKTTYSHVEPCDITPNINKILPQQQKGMYNSQYWIDFSKTNDIAGYFRIHDSGDFSIATNPTTTKHYIQSWGLIASCFPQVKFWAPTRLWSKKYVSEDEINDQNAKIVSQKIKLFKQQLKKQLTPQIFKSLRTQKALIEAQGEKSLSNTYLDVFQAVCEDNPNLIIRPSGLTVISPFNNNFIGIPEVYLFNPKYKNISAGSGVNAVFVKNKNGTDFTPAAYKYIGTDEAYTNYKKNGGQDSKDSFKGKIKSFLARYFGALYGKTSFDELPKKCYTPIFSQSKISVRQQTPSNPLKDVVQQCPVDTKTDDMGNEISSASSCMSSSCRFCWLAKNNCVTYGEH